MAFMVKISFWSSAEIQTNSLSKTCLKGERKALQQEFTYCEKKRVDLSQKTIFFGQRTCEWSNDCDDNSSVDPTEEANLDIHRSLNASLCRMTLKFCQKLRKLWKNAIGDTDGKRRKNLQVSFHSFSNSVSSFVRFVSFFLTLKTQRINLLDTSHHK